MSSIRDLIQADSQKRFIVVQVRRNGSWINVPCDAISATIGKGKAGQVTLTISNDDTDAARSQLYDGERVRIFRGVVGAAPVRCWTGWVDTRHPIDTLGTQRQIAVTDAIKEITDAIVINGTVYDGMDPMLACANIIQQAISTGQFVPKDDNDNAYSSTASSSSPTGNSVCYFPTLINDDGSTFTLPQGTIGSFTNGNGGIASFSVPTASGMAYSTFELPERYIIASTLAMTGWTIASTAQTFPPLASTCVVDYYNGVIYFNSADAGKNVTITGSFYSSPLYDAPPGTKIGDVVSQIMDASGCRWGVDGNGKFYSTVIDAVHAPTRIFNKGQYVSNEVEINRDRRNVIVCLGWDGNCGQIVAAKAVNTNDINNAPPKGLGKRTYLVVQNRSWQTQYAVNRAAYYAAQQVGRRGKVATLTILDDPTIATLEQVFCFEGVLPEINAGDFFYAEDITWNYTNSNGNFDASMNLSGTLLPAQGLVYLGPISGTTSYGSLDYTNDVQCITNPHLNPTGGAYNATFSIAGGWSLTYTIGSLNGTESVDIYGSDGSHIVGDANFARAANQTLTVTLPTAGLNAGVMYVVRLYFKDSNGNVGIYRDFLTARA